MNPVLDQSVFSREAWKRDFPLPLIPLETVSLMERALNLILTGDCKADVHYDGLNYWLLWGQYPSPPFVCVSHFIWGKEYLWRNIDPDFSTSQRSIWIIKLKSHPLGFFGAMNNKIFIQRGTVLRGENFPQYLTSLATASLPHLCL